jgi:hypothetical protein
VYAYLISPGSEMPPGLASDGFSAVIFTALYGVVMRLPGWCWIGAQEREATVQAVGVGDARGCAASGGTV